MNEEYEYEYELVEVLPGVMVKRLVEKLAKLQPSKCILNEHVDGPLTGKDLIEMIRSANAEEFVVYIEAGDDPFDIEYRPLSSSSVEIEDGKIKIL